MGGQAGRHIHVLDRESVTCNLSRAECILSLVFDILCSVFSKVGGQAGKPIHVSDREPMTFNLSRAESIQSLVLDILCSVWNLTLIKLV